MRCYYTTISKINKCYIAVGTVTFIIQFDRHLIHYFLCKLFRKFKKELNLDWF